MKVKINKEELINLTKDLIRFKSTKDNPEEIQACLNYIKDYFKYSDVIIKEFVKNNKPSLFISYRDTKKPKLLLNGHIDVIEAEEDQFNPTIDGDKLFGRGSVDMKAGVAASIVLLKEFSKKKNKPDLGLMIVSDEEIGGFDGTGYLVSKGYGGDFAIAAEPNHTESLNKLNIVIAEKGVLWLKIKTRGIACHGSRPWLGENAIEKLITKSKEIKDLFEEASNDEFWKNTINFGKIEGGDSPNRVPDLAELTIDIRYTEETNSDELLKKIKSISDIEVEVLEDAPMLLNKDNVDIINKLKKVTEEVTDNEVNLLKECGASDLRFTSEKGMPSVIFGPFGENYHGLKEYVSISNLILFTKSLKQFIIKEIK